jgi:hypothetical protein
VSNGETGQNLAGDGLSCEDGGEKAAAAGRWVLEKASCWMVTFRTDAG